jgi:hypothetical protein
MRRVTSKSNPDPAEQIAHLLATVEALTLANEVLRTQRDAPPVWRALKSCDPGPFTYECLRRWCVGGLIKAERRRGRWYVEVASLNARLAELAVFDR